MSKVKRTIVAAILVNSVVFAYTWLQDMYGILNELIYGFPFLISGATLVFMGAWLPFVLFKNQDEL